MQKYKNQCVSFIVYTNYFDSIISYMISLWPVCDTLMTKKKIIINIQKNDKSKKKKNSHYCFKFKIKN